VTFLRFYLPTTKPDLEGRRRPDYEIRDAGGIPAVVAGQRWTVNGVRCIVKNVDYILEDGDVTLDIDLDD
jgi:hypothetical protein